MFCTINGVLTSEPSFPFDLRAASDAEWGHQRLLCGSETARAERLQAGSYAVKDGSQPITSGDALVKSGLLSL